MAEISFDLSNRVPAGQAELFRQVLRVTARLGLDRWFVVGAQARNLILSYAYDLPSRRATNDIDFGIAVKNWNEFLSLRQALVTDADFTSHPTITHRLLFAEQTIVDLVPFGELEDPPGVIAWPPDNAIVMKTLGFQESYANALRVRIADDVVISVASLAGLAMLKIIAWSDRRFQRDAQDLSLLLQTYLDAGNRERLTGDQADHADLLDEDFDYELAGARLVGRDLVKIAAPETRRLIEQVLVTETAENGTQAMAVAMKASNSSNLTEVAEYGLSLLRMLLKGFRDFR